MVTWCDHLVSVDQGRFLALKGHYPSDEVAALPANISVEKSHTIAVPRLEGERHLIELVKS
jgi:16S rRNA (guanine527-N7)-methyltransferase